MIVGDYVIPTKLFDCLYFVAKGKILILDSILEDDAPLPYKYIAKYLDKEFRFPKSELITFEEFIIDKSAETAHKIIKDNEHIYMRILKKDSIIGADMVSSRINLIKKNNIIIDCYQG